MPTLLVTGHSGFVGQTLFREGAELAAAAGWQLATLPETLDIRDPALAGTIRGRIPDAVLHLAASTNVDESFRDPDTCIEINFRGTQNLLRALRDVRFDGRLLYISSGDCYGAVSSAQLPVGEDTPLRPRNPYAVSKVAGEALCYQWSQSEGLDAVIARPFNHVGPGQDPRFAIPSFCEQLARVARKGAAPVVRAGNLDVTRDFTDVRDVLRAYLALLQSGRRGEAYNVASGREVRLGDILNELIGIAGMPVSIEVDEGRRRSTEQRRVVADVAKIRRDTGWQPAIPLRETLESTLDYWNRRVVDE